MSCQRRNAEYADYIHTQVRYNLRRVVFLCLELLPPNLCIRVLFLKNFYAIKQHSPLTGHSVAMVASQTN